MKISAVAIYDITESTSGNEYRRAKSACQAQSLLAQAYTSVAHTSPLAIIEGKLLPELKCSHKDQLIRQKEADGNFYVFWKFPNHHFVMAICCQRPFKIYDRNSSTRTQTLTELHRLFTNIMHTYLRPDKVKFTLEDIIKPDNDKFLAKNQHIEGIKSDLTEDLIPQMHALIDKALDRHDQLDDLLARTVDLETTSLQFKKGAEKLNRPCCYS